MALFSPELVDAPAPEPAAVVAELVAKPPNQDVEHPNGQEVVSQSHSQEIAKPKATIRDVRAVRSLLYNRLLLEMVLKRIEKAEAIVLSYLLTQDSSAAQIGPYLVEVDSDNQIHLTMTEADGWRQLHIPEPEEDFTK